MIGYCGVICSKCPGYIATKNDSYEERKRVAELWSKMLNLDLSPEDINCDGCTSNGRLMDFCKTCEIRNCAIKKGVENCAYCPDYVCEKLDKWLDKVPEARSTLEEIRRKIQK
ncbi:hypothetical protein DRP04_09720 [Archaeoglobales archaeon]|nr:MAG: hypothetical protein DRP04_09720 [Archaeoglobales archaeon]